MNKIQTLIQQIDAVLFVLPACVAIERARLTENYYKDSNQIVSLAEKREQVKNTRSSNE